MWIVVVVWIVGAEGYVMGLNDYRDEAGEFLRAIKAGEGQVSKILEWLDEEVALLKGSVGDDQKLCHQVYDVLFLLFELAGQFGFDLDGEWDRGRERKREKYLGGGLSEV